MKCPRCKDELEIKLMPDYTSSGIWCNTCGVGFANPKESLPVIPERLIDLIEGWNILWEFACESKDVNKEYFKTLLVSIGKELQHQTLKYIFCHFDENNARITRFYK